MLLPLSLLYSLAIYLKFAFKIYKKGSQKYEIPIISIGNLVLGGSGKTPFTKMLFEHFSPKFRTFIVLRGYGRKSSGAILVAKDGEILTNVKKSGDEAMEYALSLIFCSTRAPFRTQILPYQVGRIDIQKALQNLRI